MREQMLAHPFLDEGLRRALARLDQAALSTDEVDSFIAVSEVLMWVMFLNHRYWREDATAYAQAKSAQGSAGVLLDGLRLVWDLLKHHPLERIVEVTRGIEFPATFPANVCEVRWRRLVELPSDRPGYLHPEERNAYRLHLEGRPVRRIMPRVVDFLIDWRAAHSVLPSP